MLPVLLRIRGKHHDFTLLQVTIDGVDIRDLDLAWFRSQLGVVSQEPVLFAGSVAENIKLGALDATQDEIEEAAKLARVHDFVCKLPEVRYMYSKHDDYFLACSKRFLKRYRVEHRLVLLS